MPWQRNPDNRGMSSPNRCRQLARLVLVWFALALGAAVASPLVRTQEQQLVCTAAGGFKLVGVTDDGVPRATGGLHDCPLCILAGAPPQRGLVPVMQAQAELALLPVVEHAPRFLRSAPPLPARGPPAGT